MTEKTIPPLTEIQAQILAAILHQGAAGAKAISDVTDLSLERVRQELTPLTDLLITDGETAWDDALSAYEGTQS